MAGVFGVINSVQADILPVDYCLVKGSIKNMTITCDGSGWWTCVVPKNPCDQ